MNTPLDKLLGPRLWPLFLKELRQIKRNRRLVVSLIIPPTVQLLLFGFALNPEVKNLRLGVVDESRTPESRELVSAFVESLSFEVTSYYESPDALGRSLSAGRLDAGLIVPEDYAKRRARRETADVQLLIDAVNSNTAAIAGGYAARIVAALNQKLASPQRSAPPSLARANITPRIALLYNPGLQNAWFIVTGTLGTLLVLNGSLVAAASMVKEKEAGTVEQLLMTPAEASEIITAKIAPLFLLLTADIALALIVGYVVFGVPVRGSFVLLYTAGALCVLAGIGIGTFLATFTKSQQQAQLMGFFVNPPIALLSGVTTPVEAMPHWLQPFTNLNP
ncbi:MAG TPA: ABC transporter permease, partial [Pyrinomonadaceae bacterium]|nr:ABC transporter permease [Pyrinomonadaceae bacterium]